jgi:hypothetical protein
MITLSLILFYTGVLIFFVVQLTHVNNEINEITMKNRDIDRTLIQIEATLENYLRKRGDIVDLDKD